MFFKAKYRADVAVIWFWKVIHVYTSIHVDYLQKILRKKMVTVVASGCGKLCLVTRLGGVR